MKFVIRGHRNPQTKVSRPNQNRFPKIEKQVSIWFSHYYKRKCILPANYLFTKQHDIASSDYDQEDMIRVKKMANKSKPRILFSKCFCVNSGRVEVLGFHICLNRQSL